MLTQLTIIALAEAGQGWAQVLRVGRFTHRAYGDFEVTAEHLDTMVRNFREGVRPKPPTRLAVDYNHESGGKAAGWIAGLETRAGGAELWASVEWTEEAAMGIATKAYQFTSAEFAFAYQDKESGEDRGPTLLGMAITNRPFVEGMTPLSLSEQSGRAVIAALPAEQRPRALAALGLSEPNPSRRRTMEPKEILAILGLSEGTDPLAAVRTLSETSKAVTTERDTLRVQLTETTTERDALKLKLAEANRDALIARFEGEGKLTPAMRDGWAKAMALKDPDGLVKLMETMPKVVDLKEHGSAGSADAGTVQLTEEDRAIAKQLGLTEADVLKSKQAIAATRK
ncbi:MAG: phage protease [Anaerolineae bacterium]